MTITEYTTQNGLAISAEEQRQAPIGKWCNFQVEQELGRRTLTITDQAGTVIYEKVVIML